jgi:integrase
MAMTMLIRGMNEPEPMWVDAQGRPVVMHGFRSTFRDWAEEATATPRAVVERALAHKVANQVEAAYLRSDLLEKRKALMEQWAQQCSRETATTAGKTGGSNS